jgi:hypothetical protein
MGEQQQIQISLDEKTAGGVYSNAAFIAHNENEFTVDFMFIHPPVGRVNARVIISPAHAKRLLKALKENMDIYEKNFGSIKEAPEPPKYGINLSRN